MQAVPMIWHPAIQAEQLRQAFPERTVVEITATSPGDLSQKWIDHVQ